jgi:3'(2'), 5'-bisphosphate nucleotidase
MMLSPDPAQSLDDHHLARDIAEEAGRRLCTLREQGDRDLGALGDRLSNDYILGALATSRPGDSVLSEESFDDRLRLQADRVWIVDPLDGTREFADRGRVDWAVHVALWQRVRGAPSGPAAAVPDGVPVVGAVALPAQGMTLSTAQVPRVPALDTTRRLRITVSRRRPPQFGALLAAEVDAQLMPMGSAGAKAAAVIVGEVDAYVHAGGQHEWDSAAPVAVATAAGLHASRIDGSPLRYNKEEPLLPDLLVCRPELADRLLGVIAVLAPWRGRMLDGPHPRGQSV